LAGIDYFKPAIDYAKIMTPSVNWICGDIRDRNLFDKQFDIITLIDVLEHITLDEMRQFLKGIHYYVNDGGYLIATVPSDNTPVQKKHYQHFDLNCLKDALNPFFDVIDVTYLNRRPTQFEKIIIRLLSNRLFILNSDRILGWLYKYYLENLLIADKNNCRRIAIIGTKKSFHL